jgi:hypothetical protein
MSTLTERPRPAQIPQNGDNPTLKGKKCSTTLARRAASRKISYNQAILPNPSCLFDAGLLTSEESSAWHL